MAITNPMSFEIENSLTAKKYNASDLQPSVKKKALADVKNVIHQNIPKSNKKTIQNYLKPTGYNTDENYPIALKKKIINKIDTATNKQIENDFATLNLNDKCDIDDFVPICNCDNVDECCTYEDLMFEGFQLSKSEIENFALNWKQTPILTSKDMRTIGSLEDLEPIDAQLDSLDYMLECLSHLEEDTGPTIQMSQFDVEVPAPMLLDDSLDLDESIDCSFYL